MNINAATPFSICLPLVNECVSVPGRQQVNSCLPLRDYKECPGTDTHACTRTHTHTYCSQTAPARNKEEGSSHRRVAARTGGQSGNQSH